MADLPDLLTDPRCSGCGRVPPKHRKRCRLAHLDHFEERPRHPERKVKWTIHAAQPPSFNEYAAIERTKARLIAMHKAEAERVRAQTRARPLEAPRAPRRLPAATWRLIMVAVGTLLALLVASAARPF